MCKCDNDENLECRKMAMWESENAENSENDKNRENDENA
jgi:hypothetical protein